MATYGNTPEAEFYIGVVNLAARQLGIRVGDVETLRIGTNAVLRAAVEDGYDSSHLIARISTNDRSRGLLVNGHTHSLRTASMGAPVVAPIHAAPLEIESRVVSMLPSLRIPRAGELTGFQLGEAIGAFHRAFDARWLEGEPPVDPLREQSMVLAYLLQTDLPSSVKDLYRRAVELNRQLLSEDMQDPSWFGSVHGDCTPGNGVLDGTQLKLIDVDNGGVGSVFPELGQFAIAESAFGWSSVIFDDVLDGYHSASGKRIDTAMLAKIRASTVLTWLGYDLMGAARTQSQAKLDLAVADIQMWIDERGSDRHPYIRPFRELDPYWRATFVGVSDHNITRAPFSPAERSIDVGLAAS